MVASRSLISNFAFYIDLLSQGLVGSRKTIFFYLCTAVITIIEKKIVIKIVYHILAQYFMFSQNHLNYCIKNIIYVVYIQPSLGQCKSNGIII